MVCSYYETGSQVGYAVHTSLDGIIWLHGHI